MSAHGRHKLAQGAFVRSAGILGRRKIIKERKPRYRGMLHVLDAWNAEDEADIILRANMIIRDKEFDERAKTRTFGSLLVG